MMAGWCSRVLQGSTTTHGLALGSVLPECLQRVSHMLEVYYSCLGRVLLKCWQGGTQVLADWNSVLAGRYSPGCFSHVGRGYSRAGRDHRAGIVILTY
jgi:hypothetical protein